MIGMIPLLLAVVPGQLWYAAPLICVVSLVYAATRHEHVVPILAHAARFALWVVGFMALLMVLLMIMSSYT